MTPRELAEKIICGINNGLRDKGIVLFGSDVDFIESLLKAELDVTCTKCKRAHANFCRECYAGELSEAFATYQAKGAFLAAEEGLKIVKEVRAAAFEEAAQIVKQEAVLLRQADAKPFVERLEQLAATIRLRAGESKC